MDSGRFTIHKEKNVWELDEGRGPQGPPGPQGPKGDTGDPGASGGGFLYERSDPASTWIVEHNLHKYPNVQFYDDDGELQECDVFMNSLESTTLVFDGPTTGKAVFS